MIRFFVKGNNFVMLVWGEYFNGFSILNVLSGSLLYLDIKKGDHVINDGSVIKKTYPQEYTLNELKDQVALLATILINNGYTELRKFKKLKELPLDKKSKCNKKNDYIKKRLKKI